MGKATKSARSSTVKRGTGSTVAEGPEPFIDVPKEVLDWFESGRISVLTSIEERVPGILKDRAKADEAKTRLKDLSTGSDVTVGPCCDCPHSILSFSLIF